MAVVYDDDMLDEAPNLSSKGQIDFRLVQLARQGDQKSYADLLSKYRDSIYFLLLKMVTNKDDAEDLTIEAFGKAFKNLHQYTPNFAFSTWLFKIASNNCIDFIRKRKTMMLSIDKRTEDDEGNESQINLKSLTPNPEEDTMKREKIKLIHDVVKKLKPRYRSLVELRYFKEYSYEEIADHMNIPLGTVKAQLFRAREFLLQILGNIEGTI